MLNAYSIGFACIAAIAVAGVDYTMQAQSAGKSLGSYPIGDYLGSYADRFAEASAERDKARRQAELAKVHLPEAPEGWERREWVPDLGADPMPVHDGMTDQEREIAATVNTNLIARMEHKQTVKVARKAAEEQAWEYLRGNEVIRLSAKYDPTTGPQGPQELAMEIVATSMGLTLEGLEGYGVVQGVPSFRVTDLSDMAPADDEEAEPDRPVRLKAFIGEEISLAVHAEAGDETIRMFLERIDYDGLNMMLDRPVAGIGKDAPDLTPEQELEIAEAAAFLRTGSQLEKSGELEAGLIGAVEAMAGQSAGPKPANPAQTPASKAGSIMSMLTGLLSAGDTRDGDAEPAEKPKPTRLKLSGGNACLSGSSGRFCKN